MPYPTSPTTGRESYERFIRRVAPWAFEEEAPPEVATSPEEAPEPYQPPEEIEAEPERPAVRPGGYEPEVPAPAVAARPTLERPKAAPEVTLPERKPKPERPLGALLSKAQERAGTKAAVRPAIQPPAPEVERGYVGPTMEEQYGRPNVAKKPRTPEQVMEAEAGKFDPRIGAMKRKAEEQRATQEKLRSETEKQSKATAKSDAFKNKIIDNVSFYDSSDPEDPVTAYERLPQEIKDLIPDDTDPVEWIHTLRELKDYNGSWISEGVPGISGGIFGTEKTVLHKIILEGKLPETEAEAASVDRALAIFLARLQGATWEGSQADILMAAVKGVGEALLLYFTGGAYGVRVLGRALGAPGKLIRGGTGIAKVLRGTAGIAADIGMYTAAGKVLPAPFVAGAMPMMSLLEAIKEAAGAGTIDPVQILAHAGGGFARGWLSDEAQAELLPPATPIEIGKGVLKAVGIDPEGPLGFVADLLVDIAILHGLHKMGAVGKKYAEGMKRLARKSVV